jgi:predicted DNA-binding transcriptional regulator YafY
MPVNKSTLARFYLINECLTNARKPYWTLEEIMEKAESRDIFVSKRTLESDLQIMRYDDRLNYHAPILYCKKNKGFHYEDRDYSIEKLPLSESDIETFQMMVESFQRFKGADVLQQVEGVFDKLGKVAKQLNEKKNKLDYTPVVFEQIPYTKGIQHFDNLYQAIVKQQPLLIHYKRFDKDSISEHLFHPYLLKEYKFRWYLLGYSEKRRGKLILALDRIERITPNKKIAFKPYKGIDVQKYFDHTIGVTINPTGVKEIRVWFSVTQGNYLKTQHLHATQKIISDDDTGLIVTFQLIPNYELMQTLLAFGPECKVLEPATLQEQFKDMHRKSMELYGK